MFCKYCGKEINNDANVCPYCMRVTDNGRDRLYYDDRNRVQTGEQKTLIGVVLGLLLGIIGLIIGLLLYPAYTEERSTFISGWLIAFIISIIVGLLLFIGLVGCAACL